MFSAVFKALSRAFNQTLAPLLIAVGMTIMEFFMGAISWVVVILGNGIIEILAALLSLIPVPSITLDEGTFGREFLEIASLAGVWPALAFYLTGVAVAFVSRIVTLGFMGK